MTAEVDNALNIEPKDFRNHMNRSTVFTEPKTGQVFVFFDAVLEWKGHHELATIRVGVFKTLNEAIFSINAWNRSDWGFFGESREAALAGYARMCELLGRNPAK